MDTIKSQRGPNSLGRNIKKALKKSGRTQQDLSEHLGKDKGHISRWCNDLVRPNSGNLYAISDFTGYSVTEILTGNFTDERVIKKTTPEKSGTLSQYARQEIDSIMSFIKLMIKEGMAGRWSGSDDSLDELLEEEFGDKLEVLQGKIESLYKLTK